LVSVVIEVGPKQRAFARAVEWPGWCRPGRNEDAALQALDAHRLRYAAVGAAAGYALPKDGLRVIEHVNGTAVTDFGAIAALSASDQVPLTPAELERLVALLETTWMTFDAALASVPAKKQAAKPQRGRSAAAIRLHILEAELMHWAGLGGPAFRKPAEDDVGGRIASARAGLRSALSAAAIGAPAEPRSRYGFRWTPRFVVHRSAWHALDHAWELENRRASDV
jgi:hypothetical protein